MLKTLNLSKAQRIACYIRTRDKIASSPRWPHFTCCIFDDFFEIGVFDRSDEEDMKHAFPEFHLFKPDGSMVDYPWFNAHDFYELGGSTKDENEIRIFVLQMCIEMLKK